MTQQQPTQRDVPAWLFAIVILLCLAGGGAFVWWFFSSKPAPVAEVVLKPNVVLPDQPRPQRPNRANRNRRDFPPLPTAQIPAGNRITKKWDNAPLSQVVADLSTPKGMDVTISDTNLRDRKITLDTTDQPFWAVIRSLCQQANLKTQSNYDRKKTISLFPDSSPKQPPAAISGPFLLTLDQITHSVSMDLGGGNANHNLQLNFNLAMEPGAGDYGVVNQAIIEEAVDQAGKSLLRDRGRQSLQQPNWFDNGWRTNLYGQLTPSPDSNRIAKLRGYATIITYEKLEPFEIENPLDNPGKSATIDGIPVTFKKLKKQGDNYSADFEAGGSYYDPAVFYRFTPTEKTVELIGDKGKPFNSGGGGWGGGNDTFPFSRHFSNPQGQTPAKLILKIPVGVKEIRIPFEFTDLPLPG